MMEWIPCTECIYVNEDCIEARRADGCYCGEREESLKETDRRKNDFLRRKI